LLFPGGGWCGCLVLAPGGVGCGLPVLTFFLLGGQPRVLHGGDAVVGELQSVIGQELHLLIVQKQDEPLCDIPPYLNVGEVPATDQLLIAQDFQVVLVDDEHHPDSRTPVARGAQSTFELQVMTSNVGPSLADLSRQDRPEHDPTVSGAVKHRFYSLQGV
jgi:hypothetical protein